MLCKEYSIKVKKEGDLAIFNYGFDCEFKNPLVQEARGIIIDTKKLEVRCWPFRKFGNHNESYADKIDWTCARVLEKVDGSIIKLWFDIDAEKWQFSTNGTIRAEKASIENYPGLYFGDVIRRADNYKDIPFDSLDRDKTYIFELVSPETKVIVSYGAASLYHIGTRNNKTGLESEDCIGIKKPASYALTSLEECIRAAALLNADKTVSAADDVVGEGFVVVDGNYNRVKVKSPDYLMMHRLASVDTVTKRDALYMLISDVGEIKTMTDANPALVPLFKYYDYRLSELKYQADKLALLAKSLYKEYTGDRSAVAKVILKHKLSFVGFRAIDSGESGGEILLAQPIEKLAKMIPDYEPDDMYSLFLAKSCDE
jgi:hypothetical protein